jgi:alkanesulfonate monooxygenase SsuD/methylene tetrahydromethanopterin reductase-like flavin-dependent oxidoreductase (luciferase family)
MRFGLFWQTPGSEESSVARRHWETIEEIVLGEQLGFESAWLAESVFYPTRPMSNPLMVAIAAAQRTERLRFGTLAAQAPSSSPIPRCCSRPIATIPSPMQRAWGLVQYAPR